LQELASKLAQAKNARAGDIVLRLSGKGGATYRLSSGRGKAEVTETTDVPMQPLIEVIGDAVALQAVIDGKIDARKQFLAGGIRVRGDLQHLSDLAVELGLLKHPL
jgi:putative sterol carrier protein